MYFNTKYERSGPLFVRPFRAKHVADDDYLRWLFSYVHLNPLDVHQSGWKERGLSNFSRAEKFLNGYAYSSYADYFGSERPQRHILSIDALPFEVKQLESVKDMFDEYSNGNYLYA